MSGEAGGIVGAGATRPTKGTPTLEDIMAAAVEEARGEYAAMLQKSARRMARRAIEQACEDRMVELVRPQVLALMAPIEERFAKVFAETLARMTITDTLRSTLTNHWFREALVSAVSQSVDAFTQSLCHDAEATP